MRNANHLFAKSQAANLLATQAESQVQDKLDTHAFGTMYVMTSVNLKLVKCLLTKYASYSLGNFAAPSSMSKNSGEIVLISLHDGTFAPNKRLATSIA